MAICVGGSNNDIFTAAGKARLRELTDDICREFPPAVTRAAIIHWAKVRCPGLYFTAMDMLENANNAMKNADIGAFIKHMDAYSNAVTNIYAKFKDGQS